MKIFQRMSDIFSANIHDMIDRFEDPEIMLKQAIRETYAVQAQAERRSRRRPRSAGERVEPTRPRPACQIGSGRHRWAGAATATRKEPFPSVTVTARSVGARRFGPVQSAPVQRTSNSRTVADGNGVLPSGPSAVPMTAAPCGRVMS